MFTCLKKSTIDFAYCLNFLTTAGFHRISQNAFSLTSFLCLQKLVAPMMPQTVKEGDPWMTMRTWAISQKESPALTLPPVGSHCHVIPVNPCLMLTSRWGHSWYHMMLWVQCDSLSLTYSIYFCLFYPSPHLRRILLQLRNHLSMTQQTSWAWTLILNLLPCLQPPLLLIRKSREDSKLLPATVTSSMTCLHPLLVSQVQCRMTCSSVDKAVELHQTQNVRTDYDNMYRLRCYKDLSYILCAFISTSLCLCSHRWSVWSIWDGVWLRCWLQRGFISTGLRTRPVWRLVGFW